MFAVHLATPCHAQDLPSEKKSYKLEAVRSNCREDEKANIIGVIVSTTVPWQKYVCDLLLNYYAYGDLVLCTDDVGPCFKDMLCHYFRERKMLIHSSCILKETESPSENFLDSIKWILCQFYDNYRNAYERGYVTYSRAKALLDVLAQKENGNLQNAVNNAYRELDVETPKEKIARIVDNLFYEYLCYVKQQLQDLGIKKNWQESQFFMRQLSQVTGESKAFIFASRQYFDTVFNKNNYLRKDNDPNRQMHKEFYARKFRVLALPNPVVKQKQKIYTDEEWASFGNAYRQQSKFDVLNFDEEKLKRYVQQGIDIFDERGYFFHSKHFCYSGHSKL